MAKNAGLVYEKHLKKLLIQYAEELPNISVDRAKTAGNAKDRADIFLKIIKMKKLIGMEIKLNVRARMGESARIGYNYLTNEWSFTDKTDGELDPMVEFLCMQALLPKEGDLRAFFEFIHQHEPVEYNSVRTQLPVKCTEGAWNDAKAKGLLRKLNGTVKFDASIIHDWYASKGIYYLQGGKGMGFFYLKDNPLNLPVDQLTGKVNIELRLKNDGAKGPFKVAGNERTVAGAYTVENRLVTAQTSKWDLENKEHFVELFGKL